MKKGDVWHNKKEGKHFKDRAIKLLRKYDKDPAWGQGWFVQGSNKGLESGSEYKISTPTIHDNWYPETGWRLWVRRVVHFFKFN